MQLSAHQAMALAIEEGKRGAGFVAPNPCVGCVILDGDGYLIGKGFHAQYGSAHAEINALNSVVDRQRLKGAHVFVTLEPCAHVGKTGSCAEALAQLPIASVTYGLIDPFAKVAGKGIEILRKAKISVFEFAELQSELRELSEIFLHNVSTETPLATIKVATSLDGQMAMASGESQWITGSQAREYTQVLRGCYDAVLVGATTILKDNPQLNSRDPRFVDKRSRVVILDPTGSCVLSLSNSNLLRVRAPKDVIIVTSQGTNTDCELLVAPLLGNGQFDLQFVFKELFRRGICSLLVEGGAFTVSAILEQRMAQRVYVFMAAKILGKGLGWSGHLHLDKLANGIALKEMRVEKLGDDFLFTARLTD